MIHHLASPAFWVALGEIIMVNIVLSGDNAVVIALGLSDERIHALILGYWHTIVTPPMVFANKMVEVIDEMRAKDIEKPVVVSLAGDVQVEEAAEFLFDHGIPAYPYTTETPVMVLGAKYQWARGAGLI